MAKTKENKAKDSLESKIKETTKSKMKVQPYYTYVLSGGAIKSGICLIGKGYAHPESELEKYKPYYGNDVKGYFTKTTKSPELIEKELNKALSDNQINDILYKGYVNEIKKILKEASEVTKCTSMNVYTSIEKKVESDNDEPDDEAQSDNDESEEEVIVKTKKTKNSKVKETKPKKEEKVVKKEPKKIAKETKKSTKKIKKVIEDSDSDSDDEVYNKTSIILSDESESESEIEEA
jgi:hypothetical protein